MAGIMLCLPIVVLGWCLIGGLIGLFFREAKALSMLFKLLFEGPWIFLIFFRALPSNGKYAVLPFLFAYVLFQALVAYHGFSDRTRTAKAFSAWGGISASLAIVTAIGTYVVLLTAMGRRTTVRLKRPEEIA